MEGRIERWGGERGEGKNEEGRRKKWRGEEEGVEGKGGGGTGGEKDRERGGGRRGGGRGGGRRRLNDHLNGKLQTSTTIPCFSSYRHALSLPICGYQTTNHSLSFLSLLAEGTVHTSDLAFF